MARMILFVRDRVLQQARKCFRMISTSARERPAWLDSRGMLDYSWLRFLGNSTCARAVCLTFSDEPFVVHGFETVDLELVANAEVPEGF